jgi:hypothetical protein
MNVLRRPIIIFFIAKISYLNVQIFIYKSLELKKEEIKDGCFLIFKIDFRDFRRLNL